MPGAKETTGQIEYYSRAMKAPRIREAAARLADQARDNGWTHEEYLAAVLSREVAAREASGAETRARAAGFPARKSLEDFSFDHQPGLKRDTIAHLATGAFLTEASNIVLLGPPGTGKTHLATGLGLRATQLGHRVLFATAIDWVARLQSAHQNGRLPQELVRLRRYGLIIVDEVGYIPFEQDAANLFFQLVSSRYEHASLILTSNLPFARWGDVFGDQVVASAMIDRTSTTRKSSPSKALATASSTHRRTHCPRQDRRMRQNSHVNVAQFSTHEMAHFSTIADRRGSWRSQCMA
ncbi:IS21-like element helper ATPase IstB [Arthrobacter sp. ISL-69]|uniref:IS21-like element helper ATPase IstB n=1 Tax=Arthrobacter sp. ISL-69 TaxID=2819113 RepID=UPI00288A657B|nr:IS21-like element helper ATPase IstB [Arthrobacter sp. ISL-69]